MTKLAEIYKGRLLFISVPKTDAPMMKWFLISEDALPSLVITDSKADSGLRRYPYYGPVAEEYSEKLIEFMNSFLDGLLHPHLKSEEFDPNDLAGPIITVKGKSFMDLVINNDKNVFIEIASPR